MHTTISPPAFTLTRTSDLDTYLMSFLPSLLKVISLVGTDCGIMNWRGIREQ
jgi:hypothetical protein